MIDLSNFTTSSFKDFDINLVQHEVGGGTITIEQIDSIDRYPDAKSIVISGLKQDTFEYFIRKYGKQFDAISFWKNKLVSDISALETLNNVKYINWYWNQRVTSLWNMKHNSSLKGLRIFDFARLHSIDEIETAPILEYFSIGNATWGGMEIESLKPIVNSSITHFEWYGKKVMDNDFSCLAKGKILELDINSTQFTMEELAELLALFPASLKGTITKPYETMGIKDKDGYTKYHYLCKHKRTCIVGEDDDRFEKYLKEFDDLLETKRKDRIDT